MLSVKYLFANISNATDFSPTSFPSIRTNAVGFPGPTRKLWNPEFHVNPTPHNYQYSTPGRSEVSDTVSYDSTNLLKIEGPGNMENVQ